MRHFATWGFAVATFLMAVSATAESSDESGSGTEAPAAAPEEKNFSHLMQFGVRASVLGGYRMVFRYDDSPFCSEPNPEKSLEDQQKFCGHMGPATLDLALSFAPLGGAEPFIMGRFGFKGESQTNTQPLKVIAVGARLYTRKRQALKIFVEPSVGMEFEEGAGSHRYTFDGQFDPQYKTDLVFRAAIGPQFDFNRYVGAYVQVFGMSVGVLRYIQATMEFGGGVQVRFP